MSISGTKRGFQDLRVPAGVKLFNAHDPDRRDSLETYEILG